MFVVVYNRPGKQRQQEGEAQTGRNKESNDGIHVAELPMKPRRRSVSSDTRSAMET